MRRITNPRETKNLDSYGDRRRSSGSASIGALDKIARPGGGGRGGPITGSATTRPDGRPHLMAVGIVWDDGSFYLSTGAGTQKGKNLAHDPRCTVSVAAPGIDIVAEGRGEDHPRRGRAAADRHGPIQRLGSAGPRRRLLARVQRAERRSAAVGRVRDHADDRLRGCVGGAARRHPLAPMMRLRPTTTQRRLVR